MYRENKRDFKREFLEMYPDVKGSDLAEFWKARLEPAASSGEIKSVGSKMFYLLFACFVTCFLIELPSILDPSYSRDFLFYSYDFSYPFAERNAKLIMFFGMSLYVILSNNLFSKKYIKMLLGSFLFLAAYVNFLPADIERESDSISLVYVFLPFLTWCVFGLIYMGADVRNYLKRIDFIRYYGNLIILGTLILIAGMILTGVTLGLFGVIDIEITEFYFKHIVVWGLVCAPIVATHIIRIYPSIANRIAPVIASVFSPLVLITLIAYLMGIFVSGKDFYHDRGFLLMINLMLLGVLGVVVFSVFEISRNKKQRFGELVLFLLAAITLVIDVVALSAILYRLGEYGLTPNRMVVLGSNVVVLLNLVWITIDLFKVSFGKLEIKKVEMTIARYLPVYMLWAAIVVFLFPFFFGFK